MGDQCIYCFKINFRKYAYFYVILEASFLIWLLWLLQAYCISYGKIASTYESSQQYIKYMRVKQWKEIDGKRVSNGSNESKRIDPTRPTHTLNGSSMVGSTCTTKCWTRVSNFDSFNNQVVSRAGTYVTNRSILVHLGSSWAHPMW